MTEQFSVLGSGTLPFVPSILHSSLGGTYAGNLDAKVGNGKGVRGGIQVIVANPEDIVSAPAFMCSGITVGTATPVQIWAPDVHEALIRRRRNIKVENLGVGDVYVGHNNQVTAGIVRGGFKLVSSAASGIVSLDLPIMGGASVWAIAANANADVRVLVY
jgi:hypothetical protein